jgi:integrase
MYYRNIFDRGGDFATVRELLGHKMLTMTLRYSHHAPSHKVKTVDLLDSKLNEVCGKEVSVV